MISDGTNLSFTGTGEVTIVAVQIGNESWSEAPLTSQTFMVRSYTFTLTPALVAHGSIEPSSPIVLNPGDSTGFVVRAAFRLLHCLGA